VLQAVPESRLFLKTTQLTSPGARQSVIERFAAHGIDADRMILEGASPRAEHLAAYQRVDIALDPFPIPGGTTSVEALWMAVPVLTLVGEHFMSYIGESTLQNAGLPDWVAYNADDYVKRASAHAADIASLASLRNRLRQQVLASPLCDAARFARHFDTALREMWVAWCNRQPVLE
jgi:predicted O-linked N-acetylglucosamine transferase (SPINDLY family)